MAEQEPVVQAEPTMDTKVAALPSEDDATTRVLKRGDLVRVAERRGPGIKTRDGGLGRITKSIPNPSAAESGEHPFLYEVDFVLGGREKQVPREDLIYTTADAEGMTERRKRDRNPSTAVKEMEETKIASKQKKAVAKRKKAGGAAAKGKTTTKRGKATTGTKGKNGKVAGRKTPVTKKAAAAKQQQQQEETVVKNLYESHQRELEKCLARLEKQDTYAFFREDPPPEFDEHYGDDEAKGDGGSDGAQQQSTVPQALKTPTKPTAPPVFPATAPFNFAVIRKRMAHGRYVLDRVKQHKDRTFSRTRPALVHPKGVHWDNFRDDVVKMCDAAIARDPEGTSGGRGTLGHTAEKTKNLVLRLYESNGRKQIKELEDDEARHKFYNALKSNTNNEAAMQGKWRKTAFPERIYERLSSNVVCAGLSASDERTANYELQTSLPDSFVGLSYTYTDTGQSEGWMKSVLDHTKSNTDGAQERQAARDLANDDGVVRAQVRATMTSLLIGVQDRVMTDAGVLKDEELKSANWAGDVDDAVAEGPSGDAMSVDTISADSPDIVEQPVWGIDCYTRKNISLCIEKDFDSAIALEFIEKWLLPAINACPVSVAHNMINAARILEGLSLPSSTALEEDHADDSGDERWSHSLLGKALKEKMKAVGPPWLKSVAHQLRLAISTLGHNFFRVHPKGHGAIVLQPKLKANTLLTFYRGEVYPSWRWGEKMDAIELTQNRLGLRPNLPDFYNMALERPQVDPRGYGLLFVDASRKAGHGSSLSHSCEPTCEVRVAAIDGQLCLAMTTLRELELGEELTFDYNAVTESLNEYRSAVCLCGHGRCRGSFLHFATADCYQEVLNRNSPIAVRFSNIIKGCTKQVMSEADESLLASHGFGTAAFGGASFKRTLSYRDAPLQQFDSMENVPIWLRTYVADTIRYIEYERRALPVMLLCNDLKRTQAGSKDSASDKSSKKRRDDSKSKDVKPAKKPKRAPKKGGGPIKGSKPEPVFLFFARKQSDFFKQQLVVNGLGHLKGREQQGAIMTVASSCWKALSDEMKQKWKDHSVAEWKENGGEEKARLEAERQKAEKATLKRKPKDEGSDEAKKKRKKEEPKSDKIETAVVHSSRISFEAADAEGISAMEQRIQQLTQTLSRVGRVLDRHRESRLHSYSSSRDSSVTSDGAVESVHSPLAILSDDDVVHWLWFHEEGPVRSLLRSCSSEKCVSPSLLETLKATEKKHSALLKIDMSSESTSNGQFPCDARAKVTTAILELRENLCMGLMSMEGEFKQHDLERLRQKNRARRAAKKKEKEAAEKAASSEVSNESSTRETVSSLLDGMVNTVVERAGETVPPADQSGPQATSTVVATNADDDIPLSSWLQHFSDRWKLEAAADLLLFYAHTNAFFAIKPYTPLESTPIEVYARELGNEVPQSVIETAQEKMSQLNDGVVLGTQPDAENSVDTSLTNEDMPSSHALDESGSVETTDGAVSKPKTPKAKSRALCEPDDIITNVTITYRGDYVLSQLLQWYNGGIGQKPGLPDLAGCVVLPLMSGPWKASLGGKSGKKQPTRYASEVRPILLDWLNDPRKRGNPFEGLLSEVFPGRSALEREWDDEKLRCPPVGSPVLDFLVTGDDLSLRKIGTVLSETIRSSESKNGTAVDDKAGSTTERLQNTVDEGMPAQAVSHWVQCENPDCLKWRKLPWHVDADALPEKFYCSDNIWDAKASSCDAPEDTWDEYDAQLKNDGIAKQSDADMVAGEETEANAPDRNGINFKEFVIGARFDVLRTGKEFYCTGEVVGVNFSGPEKRVMFHYPKTKAMYDEWIEIDSPRIAPLHSKQDLTKGGKSSKTATKHEVKAKIENSDATTAPRAPLAVTQHQPVDVGPTQIYSSGNTLADTFLKAQLLKETLEATANARTSQSDAVNMAQNAPFSPSAQPSYVTNSTVHGDGSVSMQLSNGYGYQNETTRPYLAAENHPSSPVISSGTNFSVTPMVSTASPSFRVPRKSSVRDETAMAMNGSSPVNRAAQVMQASPNNAFRGGGNDALNARIPHNSFPEANSSSFQDNVMANEASRFFGMSAASALTRNALNSSYFQPSLQEPLYQQVQMMQGGQRQPSITDAQYVDCFLGQHQQQQQPKPQHEQQRGDPRYYGGSPSRRQYEYYDRR